MSSVDWIWTVGSVVVEGGLIWGLYWLGSKGKAGAKGTGVVVLVALPVMFVLAPAVFSFVMVKTDRYAEARQILMVEVIAAAAVMLGFSVTSFKRSAVFVAVFCAIHAVGTFALTSHFGRECTPLQAQLRSLAGRAAGRAHLKPTKKRNFREMNTIRRKDWDAGGK